MAIYTFNFEELWSGNLDFDFGVEDGVITIPLNIGTIVLDIWNDNDYLLVCTTQGAECLNNRTFDSLWYFESTIIQSICSNQEKVCFGTAASGLYYNDLPTSSGNLGNGFLDECKTIILMTSSGIVDICSIDSGFFSGGENGVDILRNKESNKLEVMCQLTCSGVNSVAYSVDTGTYYWSTATTVYSADSYV